MALALVQRGAAALHVLLHARHRIDRHADIADPRTRTFQFLLQAATSPTTAPLLGRAVQERFLAPIREWLGDAAGQERARVLAAIYIGFLVERLIRGAALEGAARAAFVERVTAVIDGVIGG